MPAQRLLSTVARLDQRGQRYGVEHVVDILRGKATDRVRQLRHDGLTTFGIGADLSDGEWRTVVRQLVAARLLGVKSGHSTLYRTVG